MTALENVMVGRHRHEASGIVANFLHLPNAPREFCILMIPQGRPSYGSISSNSPSHPLQMGANET